MVSAGYFDEGAGSHGLAAAVPAFVLGPTNEEFARLWQRHEVDEHGPTIRQIVHSEVGALDLDCDILTTQRHDLRIMMYPAEPGSESDSKLALLGTIGNQNMAPSFQ